MPHFAPSVGSQLFNLADELGNAAIGNFWGTLTATLVGALFAGIVSVALYRGESRSRQRREVDAATVTLIRAIQEHSDAYRRWQVEYQAFSVNAYQSIGKPTPIIAPPLPPDLDSIDTAAGALIVLTTGKDRTVASCAQKVLTGLSSFEDSSHIKGESAALRSILVEWRAKRRSSPETVIALEVMEARRTAFNDGVPEEQWPLLPVNDRSDSR